MAFKMKYNKDGFPFKKTIAKEKSFEKEMEWPKGYTKEDIKFLKEQKEDVVRYEDLDEKGKAIWRKLRNKQTKN